MGVGNTGDVQGVFCARIGSGWAEKWTRVNPCLERLDVLGVAQLLQQVPHHLDAHHRVVGVQRVHRGRQRRLILRLQHHVHNQRAGTSADLLCSYELNTTWQTNLTPTPTLAGVSREDEADIKAAFWYQVSTKDIDGMERRWVRGEGAFGPALTTTRPLASGMMRRTLGSTLVYPPPMPPLLESDAQGRVGWRRATSHDGTRCRKVSFSRALRARIHNS